MAKSKKDKHHSRGPVIENRKARHDYHISETLETGIVLQGSEVKSIRDGRCSIAEGYVRATAEPPELWLHNVTIQEYAPAGALGHPTGRARRLLAHKREIIKLAKASSEKGSTIVPLKLYFTDTGLAKLLIGVGVGQSRSDQRERIAKREADRDIARAMTRKRQ